jgi:uncharacterized membrane protein YhfC
MLSGIGMILVALGSVAYVVRRRLSWGALALGALAWGVTVALKFAWAIPCNPPIYTALRQAMPSLCDPLFMVYIGALTGIFEVGLVALLLYFTLLGKAVWPSALAFGIGFGAMEALFFGVVSLSSTIASMLLSMIHPPTAEVAARLGTILWVAAPVVERLAAIVIQVCTNVLIFYAVNTRQACWFWLAFGCKTAVDAMAAVFVHIIGIDTIGRAWAFEAMMLLVGVASLLCLRWLAPRYQALPSAEVTTQAAHGAA